MTRDDIIRMAQEAKLSNEIGAFGYPYLPELERFAALVAAAERKVCAKLCDEVGMLGRDGLGKFWADKCIAAIRARGE